MTGPSYNTLSLNGEPLRNVDGYSGDAGHVMEVPWPTPFPGPHRIDIALQENNIALTLASRAEPSRTAQILLPIRTWRDLIQQRTAFMESSTQTMRSGTASEIDASLRERTAHHDQCASKLQHAFSLQGMELGHEQARSLFAVIAGATGPSMPARSMASRSVS